jgi:hypothetical protein
MKKKKEEEKNPLDMPGEPGPVFWKLFNLKNELRFTWFTKSITARTKKDFQMSVWNQVHPVEKNTKVHVCKAGTRVRIWMVSRFGDVGITDNLENPHGYDCRGVDPDKDLEDIRIDDAPADSWPLNANVTVASGSGSFIMAIEPIPNQEKKQ